MAISFDYNATIRQSEQMRQIALEMRRIADSDMSAAIQNIKANWKGISSDNFCRKFDLLRSKITQESQSIAQAADTLARLAQSIKEAEERAEREIAERKAKM